MLKRSLCVLCGLTAVLAGATHAVAQGGPAQVKAGTVEVQPLRDRARVLGELRAARRANVAAMEEGRVVAALVEAADDVGEDAVLVRLDARRIKARLAEARAERATAEATRRQREAELAKERRDYQILEDLRRENAATERELADAQTEVDVAQARADAVAEELTAIDERIALLVIRESDLEVKTPFPGRVVERLVDRGEWVEAGQAVATIVDTDTLEAWLDVPERYAGRVALDPAAVTVKLHGGGGPPLKATRVRVVPAIDAAVRTFRLVIDVAPATGDAAATRPASTRPAATQPASAGLVPGATVEATIAIGDPGPKLTVPRDAMVKDGPSWTVMKINGAGESATAAPVTVTLLFESGDRAAVASPALQAGDMVVTEGNQRLRPGSAVQIMTADETAPG